MGNLTVKGIELQVDEPTLQKIINLVFGFGEKTFSSDRIPGYTRDGVAKNVRELAKLPIGSIMFIKSHSWKTVISAGYNNKDVAIHMKNLGMENGSFKVQLVGLNPKNS